MILLTSDFQFGIDGLGSVNIGFSVGFGGLFTPVWGLFSGGAPVIIADTVTSFDHKKEWSLSDYPVERGAFETYDKVELPFDVRLRFVAGDSVANRAALLNSLAAVAGTTELFDAVTPEAVYPSVSITHYDHRRTARNGLGLLQVDVWCLQVRETAMTMGSTTTAPDASPQRNGGPVQTTAPTSTQTTSARGAVGHFN